jgi:hypothetical protein
MQDAANLFSMQHHMSWVCGIVRAMRMSRAIATINNTR